MHPHEVAAPSFAQLFRRSRHSRFEFFREDAPNQERNQNQRLEEFAVATVGFVLKHDIEFKRKFLRDFAEIEDDVEKYEVSVQDTNCADLALKNEGKRTLVVFEFKVHARLENHQNPWLKNLRPDDNTPFWAEVKDGKNGYGHEIERNYPGFSTIHYIVVRQNETEYNETKPCQRNGKTFWFKRRSWRSLLEPNSKLQEDLVCSLGETAIDELKDYRMKKIKIKNDQLEGFFKGTSSLELLVHVGKRLGLKNAKITSDLVRLCTELSNDTSLRQLGVELPLETIKSLEGIRNKFDGCEFGYYSANRRQFTAEVWFYGANESQLKLKQLLKSMEKSVEFDKAEKDASVLRVVRTAETSLSDFEWFCKVLGK